MLVSPPSAQCFADNIAAPAHFMTIGPNSVSLPSCLPSSCLFMSLPIRWEGAGGTQQDLVRASLAGQPSIRMKSRLPHPPLGSVLGLPTTVWELEPHLYLVIGCRPETVTLAAYAPCSSQHFASCTSFDHDKNRREWPFPVYLLRDGVANTHEIYAYCSPRTWSRFGGNSKTTKPARQPILSSMKLLTHATAITPAAPAAPLSIASCQSPHGIHTDAKTHASERGKVTAVAVLILPFSRIVKFSLYRKAKIAHGREPTMTYYHAVVSVYQSNPTATTPLGLSSPWYYQQVSPNQMPWEGDTPSAGRGPPRGVEFLRATSPVNLPCHTWRAKYAVPRSIFGPHKDPTARARRSQATREPFFFSSAAARGKHTTATQLTLESGIWYRGLRTTITQNPDGGAERGVKRADSAKLWDFLPAIQRPTIHNHAKAQWIMIVATIRDGQVPTPSRAARFTSGVCEPLLLLPSPLARVKWETKAVLSDSRMSPA
ncbi:hypothetical protein SODALDRAFT_378808 [Sodiomyces alkalinus F11]|uniref:Uncharacterized protein n=1 Tax=Sodiomyces alkalinus (strain CBS 110278 / VKM F-3762 / F11) TaxID=1314773 RepID=A0A3N2PVV4_SODAK|nr:hypothetical protein SODALDRAFT_378808 [Sodiomyces alkalinus F11]ROT38627.1 hypothetical protein SODALDRAFT_378808 [Sodiomyces alkalinus F11]